MIEGTPVNVESCATILRQGGVVAMPTETVYGLACDATNAQAVARVFEIKGRPSFDPLIVHVCGVAQAEEVAQLNPLARSLAEKFWPGPLTMVLPKRDVIPDIVCSGLMTVGVRMPNHPLALQLLETCRLPLAAPSANPFGYISPTRAKHVEDQLAGKIDAILDGGACQIGVESTVIEVLEDRVKVLRPGGITIDDLLTVVERVERGRAVHEAPNAPGMLKSHYAPKTPMHLLSLSDHEPSDSAQSGLIAFCALRSGFAKGSVLSESGDLREAAANIFSAMREMDDAGLQKIYVEAIPEEGIGAAIMDRIRRALAKGSKAD